MSDIPENVMKAARAAGREVYDDAFLSDGDGMYLAAEITANIIARAIYAAVEAETERCAKKASQAVYEALKSRSGANLDNTHIIISNKVFDAIRAPSVPVKETIA